MLAVMQIISFVRNILFSILKKEIGIENWWQTSSSWEQLAYVI
jgi:hypothetical protein